MQITPLLLAVLWLVVGQVSARAADGPADKGQRSDSARVESSRWPGSLGEVGDWPQWRGPDRTNVSRETGLLQRWPAGGPPLLWRVSGLGEGVPPAAVSRGQVYTLGYRDGDELLTAWDAATGAELWQARVGRAVAEQRQMRWLSQRTPTVDGDRVYVVTARGELVCLSTEGGAERWRKDYTKDFGGRAGDWGYCDFPLVDGGRLVCTPGGTEALVVALDKVTGEVVWRCAAPERFERATYSALVAADIAGVRQYVQQFSRGAVGVGTDGRVLWQYTGTPARSGNVHTALVRGDDVLFSAGWGGGGALGTVRRDGEVFTVVERHRVRDRRLFPSWLGNSSLVGDHVYTNSSACIELATGQVAWSAGLGLQTTVTVADGRLYFRLTDGTVVLAEVDPAKFAEAGRFLPPRATREPAWTTPVVAGGRLYLRDQDELLCYDVRRDGSGRPSSSLEVRPGPPVSRATATTARGAATRPGGDAAGPGRDAIFVPTPQDVVEKMLVLARVGRGDVVYDLGCGDGRVVVTAAARHGCRAVGVDIDPECVRLSRENAAKAGVSGAVRIEHKDLFEVDLAEASVVTLYLGRDVNRRLVPQLGKLKPGARVVGHQFDLDGFVPNEVVEVKSAEDGATHTLYLWTAPLKKKG